jgi:hypothetical protein
VPNRIPNQRRLAGRACQAGDLILLSTAVLGIVDFHHLHISARNVLVTAMCISTWRVILVSVGVYPIKARSTANYIFRYLIALNSCTAVVGLIDVLLHSARDVWHTVGIFWLSALALTAALRIALLLVPGER